MPADGLTDLSFDIEVAGLEWGEVDEVTRGYLLDRAKDDAERAAVPERTALVLGLGKVIAVGLWNLQSGAGALLLEGAPTGGLVPYERMPGCKVLRGSEADLLRTFWSYVAKTPGGPRVRLVSFNGRAYDLPVLAVRSAMLGVKPVRGVLEAKPWEREVHVDLMDVFGFGGWRERYKLDYWCRRFGVESPKTKLDGSQVGRAYREGMIEDIGEYCLRDTRATAEVYKKIKATLIDA